MNQINKLHWQIKKNDEHIQKKRGGKVEITQNTIMTQFIIKGYCEKPHAKTWKKNRRNEQVSGYIWPAKIESTGTLKYD